MATLNIPTVELVSTLRAAPENGPTNSQDYNDSWTESLADLASLSGFINDILLPMLNGLSNTIQPVSTVAPSGIEGRYIFSDTSDLTQLFFDALSSQPLTIADSFRILQGIVNSTEAAIANLNVEVTALQTQLSASNQNDIAQALQNFAASLSSLTSQTVSNTQAIAALLVQFETDGTLNPVQNKLNLISGTGISLDNLASSGDVVINSTVTLPSFEHNGTPNTDQTLLNLKAGTGVTLVDDGLGGITISLAGGGSGVDLETNGVANSTQSLLNLIAGTNITLGESSGAVTITNTLSDGIVHGGPIWNTDPSYLSLRDDFVTNTGGALTSGNVGQLAWSFTSEITLGQNQGPWPNIGVVAITTEHTNPNLGGHIVLTNQGGNQLGASSPNALWWPLLDYPGWQLDFVFKFGLRNSPNDTIVFDTSNTSMYIGLGSPSPGGFDPRPHGFLGCRFDTDTTSPSIGDTTLVLEAVLNATQGSPIRYNNQGTNGGTFVTSIVPVKDAWYRLTISSIVAGTVVMSLSGQGVTTGPHTFVCTAPAYINSNAGGSSLQNNFSTSGILQCGAFPTTTTFTNGYHLFSVGSLVTISGFTGSGASFANGTYVIQQTDGLVSIGVNSPNNTAVNVTSGYTIQGFPALIPIVSIANDSTGISNLNARWIMVDYFGFTWNPGVLGGAASPDATKARYF